MSTMSYSRVNTATDQSSLLSQLKSSNRVDLSTLYSDLRVSPLFKPLLVCIFVLLTVLINGVFASKTRILIEPNPYNEGAKMLRFIKRTVKLTLGTILAMCVMLFLAFGTIVVLAIQLAAHAM